MKKVVIAQLFDWHVDRFSRLYKHAHVSNQTTPRATRLAERHIYTLRASDAAE